MIAAREQKATALATQLMLLYTRISQIFVGSEIMKVILLLLVLVLLLLILIMRIFFIFVVIFELIPSRGFLILLRETSVMMGFLPKDIEITITLVKFTQGMLLLLVLF